MEARLENIAQNYNKKCGNIALIYPTSQEELCYRGISNILNKRYNNIISEDEIFNILSSRRKYSYSTF